MGCRAEGPAACAHLPTAPPPHPPHPRTPAPPPQPPPTHAPGSGGVGPVWHGRVGDGATLTLDVAPVAAQRGGAARNHVYNAFHTSLPKQKNLGRAAQRAAAAAGGRRARK